MNKIWIIAILSWIFEVLHCIYSTCLANNVFYQSFLHEISQNNIFLIKDWNRPHCNSKNIVLAMQCDLSQTSRLETQVLVHSVSVLLPSWKFQPSLWNKDFIKHLNGRYPHKKLKRYQCEFLFNFEWIISNGYKIDSPLWSGGQPSCRR